MKEVNANRAGRAISLFVSSDWFDPLEEAVRGQVRSSIEELLEEELVRLARPWALTSEERSGLVGATGQWPRAARSPPSAC